MTKTYKCLNCGKLFYFFGEAEEALSKLTDAKYLLDRSGFPEQIVPYPWKLIQKRAKCCDNPNTSPIFR